LTLFATNINGFLSQQISISQQYFLS